jgi:hypothetical protein
LGQAAGEDHEYRLDDGKREVVEHALLLFRGATDRANAKHEKAPGRHHLPRARFGASISSFSPFVLILSSGFCT